MYCLFYFCGFKSRINNKFNVLKTICCIYFFFFLTWLNYLIELSNMLFCFGAVGVFYAPRNIQLGFWILNYFRLILFYTCMWFNSFNRYYCNVHVVGVWLLMNVYCPKQRLLKKWCLLIWKSRTIVPTWYMCLWFWAIDHQYQTCNMYHNFFVRKQLAPHPNFLQKKVNVPSKPIYYATN